MQIENVTDIFGEYFIPRWPGEVNTPTLQGAAALFPRSRGIGVDFARQFAGTRISNELKSYAICGSANSDEVNNN